MLRTLDKTSPTVAIRHQDGPGRALRAGARRDRSRQAKRGVRVMDME